MLFNSFEFLIFFPVIVIFYFAIPYKWRWLLLLCGSYYFYMSWKAEYVILILVSTAIDFFAAKRMSLTPLKSKRKKFLLLSIFTNLGLLFSFKYFNFFSDSARAILNEFNIFYDVPAFDLLLPVGISFYTFQTLSYTIDVYNSKKQPETHFGKFALYVSFFPQLVAGPIERSNSLLPQLHLKYDFDYDRVVDGLRLMLWGFFKKVVIADRLAYYVNIVYNNPNEHYGFQIILATVFFAFQIFCDFSGYSDIAIGAAKVFGINLTNNFDKPYFSKSISEFWKRWHISLSTWFRDYVYIPLGGNRVIKWRWYYNLFITFLVSGLWHGANWTFVVWGALHGFYFVFAIFSKPYRRNIIKSIALDKYPSVLKVIQVLSTFILICFGWIIFRANSLSEAVVLIKNIFTLHSESMHINFLRTSDLILDLVFIALLQISYFLQKDRKFSTFLASKPTLIRWSVYVFITLSILYFGGQGGQEFIYFRF